MTELSVARSAGLDLLDDGLRALDRRCRELADEFREPGQALDRNPDAISDYLHLTGIRLCQYSLIPAQYRPALDFPSGLMEASNSCQGMTMIFERFAYIDPGVMLASPGPSLSGGVITALADPAQSDRYYRRVASGPVTTFFGLTEPGKGSAAVELQTTITPAPDGDGWLLNGEKRYIGNGARAQLGVVFCRRAPGPLGIEAVLLEDTDTPGFSADLLSTVGLRGARISRVRFDNVHIPAENLLGARLRPSRRGLQGALAILYRARPGIAAMALGCAQAACDYLHEQRPTVAKAGQLRLDGLLDRMAAVRELIYRVATDIDHGVINVHRIGAVKVQAAHLAEEATLLAAELLGPASLIEHPWLEKTYRDVRAFEIMEGTTNLHWLSVFRGVLKGTFLTAPPRAADDGAPRD
jgi:alkylation response protein AidB-like acyl-CoA dehydrogenase